MKSKNKLSDYIYNKVNDQLFGSYVLILLNILNLGLVPADGVWKIQYILVTQLIYLFPLYLFLNKFMPKFAKGIVIGGIFSVILWVLFIVFLFFLSKYY